MEVYIIDSAAYLFYIYLLNINFPLHHFPLVAYPFALTYTYIAVLIRTQVKKKSSNDTTSV